MNIFLHTIAKITITQLKLARFNQKSFSYRLSVTELKHLHRVRKSLNLNKRPWTRPMPGLVKNMCMLPIGLSGTKLMIGRLSSSPHGLFGKLLLIENKLIISNLVC